MIISANRAKEETDFVNNNGANKDKFKTYLIESITNIITNSITNGLYFCELTINGEVWEELKINDDVAMDILHEMETDLDDKGYKTNLEFEGSITERCFPTNLNYAHQIFGKHTPWVAIFNISWKDAK